MPDWPRAILFDFDGVIVNSEPLHFEGLRVVAADENIELSEQEYYHEYLGFDDRGAFVHLLKKHGRNLDEKILARLMQRKSDALRKMIADRKFAALPGVQEFVTSLARSYPLAICSGALKEEIETMLDGIELRECFSVIVAAEDVTIGKPDPEGYLLTAKLLGEQHRTTFAPVDCLIIEDAPTVIASVREAGFPVLAVATSYPVEKLSGANYVVKSLLPAEVREACPQLIFDE